MSYDSINFGTAKLCKQTQIIFLHCSKPRPNVVSGQGLYNVRTANRERQVDTRQQTPQVQEAKSETALGDKHDKRLLSEMPSGSLSPAALLDLSDLSLLYFG